MSECVLPEARVGWLVGWVKWLRCGRRQQERASKWISDGLDHETLPTPRETEPGQMKSKIHHASLFRRLKVVEMLGDSVLAATEAYSARPRALFPLFFFWQRGAGWPAVKTVVGE